MKRIAITLFLAVLLALGLVRLLRPERVKAWDMRNLPVSEGPVLCLGDSLVEGVGASEQTGG